MADKFTPGTRRGTENRVNPYVAPDIHDPVGTEKGRAEAAAAARRNARVGTEKGRATSSNGPPPVDPNTTNYSHEGRNSKVAGDGPQTLNFQFQPNILDNYDQYTYHWKLFITTPEASTSGEVFNTDAQVIIAESGISDLTIDNVRIETFTTPSTISGTGVLTGVKFEILEPVGAALLDQIYYQAIALGNPNWNYMPFYLQLQFKAREPVTSEVSNTEPEGDLASLRWLFALKLSSISANVTHVGTRYEVTAIPYDEYGLSNIPSVMQHPIVLPNLSTFGDAMEKLQDRLNIDEIYKLINNKSVPDTYKIIVDPRLAKELITPIDNNANSVRQSNTETFDGKDATYAAGTSINAIIDNLLVHTAKFQKSLSGETSPELSQPAAATTKFWRVITECRPLKYDPLRQILATEISYFIVEYNLGLVPDNTRESALNSYEAQRRRLADYAAKGIIKKKYNYIFTGLNDQILDFDMTLNNAFAVAQSRLTGVYNNAAMFDKGVVNQDNAVTEAELAKKLSSTIALINSTVHVPTTVRESAVKDTQAAIDAANVPDELKTRYTQLLEGAKPQNRLNFIRERQAQSGVNPQANLDKAQLNAKFLATPRTDAITQKQYRFISDVDISSQATLTAYSEYINSLRGQLRPIAKVDSMQQRQVGLGVEANSDSALQILNSVYATALHSGSDVTFAKTKITIKGDPFWIFPQPTINNSNLGIQYNSLKPTVLEQIDGISKRRGQSVLDTVNIFSTDNFLLLRFRTPKIYNTVEDPDAQDDPFVDVESFSGIFRVITVQHTFNRGKFTQELDLQIDTELNVVNFNKQFDAIQSQPDTPGTTTDLISGRLRDTNSKTQRIDTNTNTKGVGDTKSISAGLGANLTSNTPVAINNVISGLPPTFG